MALPGDSSHSPGYHCIICKGSIPLAGPREHRLDPCGLVIIGNADLDWRAQREQAYWCHFECFRQLVGDDRSLFIKDADFETNGDAVDQQAREAAGGEERPG